MRHFPSRLRPIALAALLAALAACSSDKEELYVERPVDELYNEAMDHLEKKEFQRAVESFDEVERQHPYSVWATKAQLMSAYTLYSNNKYDEALSALDRFIQLHPSHKDAPYAFYMKGLCYYEQITDVGRDQKMTENAMKALQEVIDRFPESKFARDARLKIDLTRDHLAGKEMSIGRWYASQKQYLAAINRFRNVVDHYQTTTHVPEALHRLSELYTMLGLPDEANKAAAVLGHNYPGNEWYEDAYSLVKEGQSKSAGKGEGWITWPW